MKILEVLESVVAVVRPRKSVEQMIEEQNTTVVSYPRVHGLPAKYIHGKVPGEPAVRHDWHPEGRLFPQCVPEADADVVRRHVETCRREPGSRGGLCDMCKKLSNPKRFDFMVRLYRDVVDGFCVKNAQDGSGLYLPATSTYLRQLHDLGLVRRERTGKFVNYYPDFSRAVYPVKEIAGLIVDRLRNGSGDLSFSPIFRVMMSPTLASAVRMVAANGALAADALAERFGMRVGDLRTYLKPAAEGGVMYCDSDDPDGLFRYVTPADPIARRIVELS